MAQPLCCLVVLALAARGQPLIDDALSANVRLEQPASAPARRAWGFFAPEPDNPTTTTESEGWHPNTPGFGWTAPPSASTPPAPGAVAAPPLLSTTQGNGWMHSILTESTPVPQVPVPVAPTVTQAPVPATTTRPVAVVTSASLQPPVLQAPHWRLPEGELVPRCPERYHRTALLVFECGQSGGTAHTLLPPPHKEVELGEVPEGTLDFQVLFSANVEARLILWDKIAGIDVGKTMGETGDSIWSGVYHNLRITCGERQGKQFCKLEGRAPEGLSLRVVSHTERGSGVQATAAMRYEHRGLQPCPRRPPGCGRFDRDDAAVEVAVWSRKMQAEYESPADAWSQETDHVTLGDKGVPWHEWVVVWHFKPTWEAAFRFMDTNNDYFISPIEFAYGFNQAPEEEEAPVRQPPTTAPPVVIAGTTPQPAGLLDKCPAGYYRSAALLFDCNGGGGVVRFSMKPEHLDKAAYIPSGVKDLMIRVDSDVDVDMYLWDLQERRNIVHWKDGFVNDKRREAVYKGTTFSFSGDDRITPIAESCTTTGVLHSPTGLRIYNYAKARATATLSYSYRGLTPCDAVPTGCAIYNRLEAEGAAVFWSQRVRKDQSSAESAWNAVVAEDKQREGITWHEWAVHNEGEEKWKMVFRFLDVDNNGHVSEEEFKRGFHLAEHRTAFPLPTTTEPTTSTLTSSTTTTTTDEKKDAPPIVVRMPQTSSPGTCYDGQYRVEPFVFRAAGRTSLVNWRVPAKAVTSVQSLPIGLDDLNIILTADDDVDLYLWDEAARRYILHWKDGVVNDQQRSGNYQGLRILFSGDDKRPPIREKYNFEGRIPVPVTLRLENFGKREVKVTMEYSYSQLAQEVQMPVGCAVLDMAKAQQAVMSWSEQERKDYPSADQAWRAHEHSSDSDAGLTWYNWGAEVAGASPDWKLSFRFLDTDNDGYIGKEEFMTGYHFSKALTQPDADSEIVHTTKPPSPFSDHHFTRRHPSPCPAGQYQRAPVVFACNGGEGKLDVTVAPGKVHEVMAIPLGVHDLELELSAEVDVDLYVWDESAGSYIVHWEEGAVSEKVRGGNYHGLRVKFSGDDRTPPIRESCKLEGITARPITVRVYNHASEGALTTLGYRYSGLSPCPAVPLGCEKYDAAVAKRVAEVCARELHTYHYSAEGAWDGLVDARNNGPCVPRQNWQAACSNVDLSQAAFWYLDRDRDGCLSRTEFAMGFHMVTEGFTEQTMQKLRVAFPLPTLDYRKLSGEPLVRRHLEDAIRSATLSTCHDMAISLGSINVDFGDEPGQQGQVEVLIRPPSGRTAESMRKYCCSPRWLSSNMRQHIAQVKGVHRVFVGRITDLETTCHVLGGSGSGGHKSFAFEGDLGPVDVGAGLSLIGAFCFTALLFYLVNMRSSFGRLYVWAVLQVAGNVFCASLVFAGVSEFVKSLMTFTPLPVVICVDYGLFLCAFLMLQVASTFLSASFSSGGTARGGGAATSTPLDAQVWVIAETERPDCDEKIHSYEVKAKMTSRSTAFLHGMDVFVKKACYEHDQKIRIIRRYTAYISPLAGFAAMHAGCALQRLVVENYRHPTAVLVPVLLNQVLLYALFRAGQLLRSSWRPRPLASPDDLDGLLRDPRREALLGEEIISAESEIAALACSFLLVQAFHYWLAGVLPGLDGLERELARTIPSKRLLILLAAGLVLAIVSSCLAHFSLRHRLVAWKRRLSNVWVSTTAMSAAWCIFWAAQWQLHRLNARVVLPDAIGELAAQLVLAACISIVCLVLMYFVGKLQDRSPERLVGLARSFTIIFAVLIGVSWRLAFGAAASAAAEDAPQPVVTKLLYALVAVLLILPAVNRRVLSKVMRYRQMQLNMLSAKGEGLVVDVSSLGGIVDLEPRETDRRDNDLTTDDSNVWRFYRRQEDQEQQIDPQTQSMLSMAQGARPRLQINIIRAKGLRNADWSLMGGKSDPYVTCEVPGRSGVKITTAVINNDLNPVWNHVGEIPDFNPGDPLCFTVYDSDLQGDDLLGRATLLSQQFLPNGFEGELPLTDSGKAVSTLTVAVKVLQIGPQGGMPTASGMQLATMPPSGMMPQPGMMPQSGMMPPTDPMRSNGWYAEPSGKDVRPLG